jgi:acetate kinase
MKRVGIIVSSSIRRGEGWFCFPMWVSSDPPDGYNALHKRIREDAMAETCPCCVLTINSGSSSLKFSVYQMAPVEAMVFSGIVERIGLHGSRFVVRDADKKTIVDDNLDLPDHEAAVKVLLTWLEDHLAGRRPDAAGHRIVHGGTEYNQPQPITAELLETLETLIRLAPEHLPHEIKAIRALMRHYPAIGQVACFDTAFHRNMPEIAQRFPMPRSLWNEGVRRYGFHGLSYEYIVHRLEEVAGKEAARGRVIVAHLGNGASMAAIRGGIGVETTMGLTPAGGLMMGTRSGDLDPGLLIYLLMEKERTPSTIDYLVNKRAGLIGVSGSTSDMLDLLRRQSEDPHAAEAIEMYCYYAKKHLAALAAALGGLDTLVFTAGVGANAPDIRRRICQGLEFMGVCLDHDRNQTNADVISRNDSPATVRVMKTDEELMIARHTYRVLCGI